MCSSWSDNKPSVTPEEGVTTPEELLDAIANGDNVRLDSDLALDSQISITGDTTINLNGNALSAQLSSAPMFNVSGKGAKLTLKGEGSVSNKYRIGSASNGGEIVIESGDYTSQDVGFDSINGGRVIMNSGSITAVEGGIIAPLKDSYVEVNDGIFTISDNFAIADNGSEGRTGNTFIINGGIYNCSIKTPGYEAVCIYIANDSTLVINGGTFVANNGTGLCMRAGHVTINGGSITATGEPGHDGWIGDKKFVLEGISAIVYHESANYPGRAGMELNINGGTFTGVDHALHILSNEAEPNIHVTGGTFQPDFPESA